MNFVNSIQHCIHIFGLYFENFIESGSKVRKEFLHLAFTCKSPIGFTTLQLTLLKVLSLLLLLTLLLISYSWRVYGKVITDKFVRPSTLKEIEELKLSVAKLKLPKEHSPRI